MRRLTAIAIAALFLCSCSNTNYREAVKGGLRNVCTQNGDHCDVYCSDGTRADERGVCKP